MPVYQITAPNGKTYRIEGPAGATQEQVQAEVLKQDPTAGTARKTIADRADSRGASGVRSFVNSATAGWGDNLTAAANAIVPLDRLMGRKEDTIWSGDGFKKAYQSNLARERASSAADAKAHPYTSMAGDIGGVVASPFNKLKAGNALARLALPAAAYGAAEGAHGGNAMQRLKGAGIGAAESVGGALVMDRLGAGARKIIAPKFSDAVKHLMSMGVHLTPGQMAQGGLKSAEDKLTSIPGIGGMIKHARASSLVDWNRAMFDKVLATAGLKHDGKVGYEAVASAGKALGKAYDTLLPHLQMKVDLDLQRDLAMIGRDISEMAPDKKTQLLTILDNRLLSRGQGKKVLSGTEVKAIDSELAAKARTFRTSEDAAAREMASTIEEIRGALRSSLERSNPAFKGELQKINRAYAQFKRLEQATSHRVKSHGIFTPGDLLNSSRKGSRSMFAKGEALLQKDALAADKVLPSSMPNSGTWDRAAGFGAILEAPHILGLAAAHPLAAAGVGAAASLYTKPGMNALKALATKGTPKARNALAKAVRAAAARTGQYLGPHAANQLLNGGF